MVHNPAVGVHDATVAVQAEDGKGVGVVTLIILEPDGVADVDQPVTVEGDVDVLDLPPQAIHHRGEAGHVLVRALHEQVTGGVGKVELRVNYE